LGKIKSDLFLITFIAAICIVIVAAYEYAGSKSRVNPGAGDPLPNATSEKNRCYMGPPPEQVIVEMGGSADMVETP
jgi:hypothetical protein